MGEPPPFTYLTSDSITSDLFGPTRDTTLHGVFFLSDSTRVTPPHQYWLTDRRVWDDVCSHFLQKSSYDTFAFLPYTSKENFKRFYPSTPLDPEDIIISEDDVHQVSRGSTATQSQQTPPRTHRPPPYMSPTARRPAASSTPAPEVAALQAEIASLRAEISRQQASASIPMPNSKYKHSIISLTTTTKRLTPMHLPLPPPTAINLLRSVMPAGGDNLETLSLMALHWISSSFDLFPAT